jgi:hypothetical protein
MPFASRAFVSLLLAGCSRCVNRHIQALIDSRPSWLASASAGALVLAAATFNLAGGLAHVLTSPSAGVLDAAPDTY